MVAQPAPKDLLTAQEVANRLSISVSTLRRMVLRGEFPRPVRRNRKWVRWKTADLQTFLDGLKPGP